MPTIPSYTATNSTSVDDDDVFIMDVDGVTRKISMLEMKKYFARVEVNSQGGSYTLVLTDEGKAVRMTSGSANNLTVPPNSSVAFPIGAQILIRKAGAGLTTVVAGSGVTINSTTLELDAQHTGAVLHKVGTNTWDLYLQAVSGGGDVTPPTITSIGTISTTQIQVAFSENVTASLLGWSFTKNGSPLTPSAIGGGGNTWNFTVPTMASGDTLAYAYNSGTGNTVDGSSNELATTSGSVDNNIAGGDVTAPTLVSAIVHNAAPGVIILTYNEALDSTSEPAPTDYDLEVDGLGEGISAVNVTGSTVEITMNSVLLGGEVLTLDYTAGTNPVQDVAGNNAANFTNQAVTNNTSGYDADAQTYFNAVSAAGGSLSTAQKDAYNDWVVAEKAASRYTKYTAIYPVMGGNAAGHAINAKTPGTYNLTFSGTWTHDANGMKSDGTGSARAETGVMPSAVPALGLNSIHIGFYCNDDTGTEGFHMGVGDPGPGISYGKSIAAYTYAHNAATAVGSGASMLGMHIVTRVASTEYYYVRAGVSNTVSVTSTAFEATNDLVIGNYESALNAPSGFRFAFATIGSGLTSSEALGLNTNTVTLQTDIGRA